MGGISYNGRFCILLIWELPCVGLIMKRPLVDIPFAPRRFGFFYGWVIVAASTLAVFASVPGQTIGVGVFTDYLIEALGLSREQLSLAYMFGTLASGLLIPLAGTVLDRIGIRATPEKPRGPACPVLPIGPAWYSMPLTARFNMTATTLRLAAPPGSEPFHMPRTAASTASGCVPKSMYSWVWSAAIMSSRRRVIVTRPLSPEQ